MVVNICAVFAKDEQTKKEYRAGWIARGETLDIMYAAIDGLNNAELETKNFIYDALLKKVYPLALAAQEGGNA